MRTRITLLVLALLLMAVPASAQQLFDFLGQTVVPGNVGGMLNMDSIMRDPAPGTTPIPLDFANYEYTLVVMNLTLDSGDGTSASPQNYSGGMLVIYEDNGTAADYANPATFHDGTAILIGNLTTLNRTMFTATLGSAAGWVDWTGGTRLDDIAPVDQLGWPFLTGISARDTNVEPGYTEQWDGKCEPEEPIVDTEDISWGSVKAMLR
ncbi:MAG: hypothetical protein DRP71_17485 [Verrucomicrobia bacterium]|nr:MAG: hypothetical protein DRP71_17485 [Verrucomicrobiota bacterium]